MRVTAGDAYTLMLVKLSGSSVAYWLLAIQKWERQGLVTWHEASYLRLYRDQDSFLNRREVK